VPAAKSSRRTAGEGSGRTARMHIPEESDSGIVPMNHSNKDGTLLAESEEGRLLIKENALPSGTYPTLSGSARVPRIGECADKLYLGRHLSAIRAACANERSCGSVRGGDQQMVVPTATPVPHAAPQAHSGCSHVCSRTLFNGADHLRNKPIFRKQCLHFDTARRTKYGAPHRAQDICYDSLDVTVGRNIGTSGLSQ
jgi:hypothetical protein